MLKSLNHQFELIDGDFGAWNSVMEVDLDFLSEYNDITSVEMYYDFMHVKKNKKQVLQKLIEEVKAKVLIMSTQEDKIKGALKKLPCEIIDEDNKVRSQQ